MKTTPRNITARMMIIAGVGRKQVFRDRRNRRAKDAKKSWRREEY